MKFIFSLMLIISIHSQASLVHITSSANNIHQAQIIRDIFKRNYSLPLEFIEVHIEKDCKRKFVGGLNICLGDKQSLSLIRTDNIELIKRSILSFTEKKRGNNVY